MIKKRNKLIRILRAAFPSKWDLSFWLKSLFVMLIISSFFFIFKYASEGQNKARAADTAPSQSTESTSNVNTTKMFQGVLTSGVTATFIGDAANQKCEDVSSAVNSLAGGEDLLVKNNAFCIAKQAESSGTPIPSGVFMQINFGATGRLLSANQSIYQTEIASPRAVIQYYANRVTGRAEAASPSPVPLAGQEVLAPILTMSNAMRDLAYGVIIIVLIISSLSTLLATLGGGEQKFTIVQLLLNAGLTIILITFFYTISSIIYDLSVNYGNALVSSIMEPYINARVILERLQPGGELNISALTNTFEFMGVSDGLTTVIQNVIEGLKPAITQTGITFGSAVGKGVPIPVVNQGIGAFLGLMGGGTSFAINSILTSVLGDQAVFTAIIAFSIFLVNMKIFFNLINAFIKYNVYTAFGPLLMLRAIGGGYDHIKNTFKTLFAYGLVFPITFLFILLGAAAMNIFIRGNQTQIQSQNNGVAKTVLCKFSTADTDNTNGGTKSRDLVGDIQGDDPKAFRYRTYINQDIFDTKPSKIYDTPDQLRDCRSKLFPLPWTYIPAPFGNYGNRLYQVQTTDLLVRTFLGLTFLVMAARAPNIIIEILGVEELKSLKGIGGAIFAGAQPFLGLGGASFAASIGLGSSLLKGAVNMPFFTEKFKNRFTGKWSSLAKRASLADIFKEGGKINPGPDVVQAFNSRQGKISDAFNQVNPQTGRTFAQDRNLTQRDVKRISADFAIGDLAPKLGAFSNNLNIGASVVEKFSSGLLMTLGTLETFGKTIGQVTALFSAEALD